VDNIVVVGKFTIEERSLVKSLVATLTLKRMSDNEIIESIFHQTNKMISRGDDNKKSNNLIRVGDKINK
jgi:hypothetical protein